MEYYLSHCNAWTDLTRLATQAYRNNLYVNERTGKIYRFEAFVNGCKGDVVVKNVRSQKEELLPPKEWFSLLSIPMQTKRQPKKSKTLEDKS